MRVSVQSTMSLRSSRDARCRDGQESRHDFVALCAQVRDAALQDVSHRYEPILCQAHAGWSSGCQDVTRNHSHVARKIGKHLVSGKPHVTRIPLLLIVAVDFRPYAKVHWIDARSQVGPGVSVLRLLPARRSASTSGTWWLTPELHPSHARTHRARARSPAAIAAGALWPRTLERSPWRPAT